MVLEPPSSTLITETDSEMETTPKPCPTQPSVPVYKRKLTPAIQTPFPIDNTPRKKQCIIHDFYGPNSWYNTPAITHNSQSLATKESQSLSLALNNSLSTTMKFDPLLNDEYLEIATALLASTSLVISTTALEIVDTFLDKAQTLQCTLQSAAEPTAKWQKLQVLNHAKYQAISQCLRDTVVTFKHGSQILVIIDSILKAHRAQKIADATIDLIAPEPPPPPTTTAD
jgi:hypothetical protein